MTNPESQGVYERTNDWKFAELEFSPQNLQVLALIDGWITVAEICDALNLTVAEVAKDIHFLEKHDLIQVTTETSNGATKVFNRSSENIRLTNRSSAGF